MLLPLLALGVMAIISGYGFIADFLVPYAGFEAHGFELGLPFYVSMGSLALGIIAALLVYGCGKRTTDPLAGNCLSTALRKRLYIDTIYDKGLIGGIQEYGAQIIEFADAALIRVVIVQGFAWLTAKFGMLLSWIQNGSLRGYALVAGIGIVIFVFILAFTIPTL